MIPNSIRELQEMVSNTVRSLEGVESNAGYER